MKVLLIFMLFLSSCATYQHQAELYPGKNSELFKITIDSIKENGFTITSFDKEKQTIKASISSVYRKALYLDAKVNNDNTVDIIIDPSVGISADTGSLMEGIHTSIKEKTTL